MVLTFRLWKVTKLDNASEVQRRGFNQQPCKTSRDQLQLLMETLAELDACNRTLVSCLEKTSQQFAFPRWSRGTDGKALPGDNREVTIVPPTSIYLLMSASICAQTFEEVVFRQGQLVMAWNSPEMLLLLALLKHDCEGPQRAGRCGQKNKEEHYVAKPHLFAQHSLPAIVFRAVLALAASKDMQRLC